MQTALGRNHPSKPLVTYRWTPVKKKEIQRNWWGRSGSEGTDFFSQSFSRKLICLPSSKLWHCPASWNWWARFALPILPLLTPWVAGFITRYHTILPSSCKTSRFPKN